MKLCFDGVVWLIVSNEKSQKFKNVFQKIMVVSIF